MSNDKKYPMSVPSISQLEIDNVTDAVTSGWISSLGPYVTGFENKFADYCETDYALAVSNGTVAIHLALCALRIGKGDEVIIPDLSFIATANAVLMAGATPVFCDIEAEYLAIDPTKIEALITSKTKAIMVVHLYGHPADMTAINVIAKKHNLKVIEDAAEAHGARWNGRRVGGLGDCATFSFYGNKNLTTGEGGMITSNDGDFIARCRMLRDHAMSPTKRYWHEEMGFNYRITNLQAALGCAQLDRAESLVQARKDIFAAYQKGLGQDSRIKLNREAQNAESTYWVICAEIDGLTETSRDRLLDLLKVDGVDARPYFYPMSDMPYLKSDKVDTPVTHSISPTGLNLPTYAELNANDVSEISRRFINALDVL